MVARDHRSDKFGSPIPAKFIPLAAILAPECAVGDFLRVAVGIFVQVLGPFRSIGELDCRNRLLIVKS